MGNVGLSRERRMYYVRLRYRFDGLREYQFYGKDAAIWALCTAILSDSFVSGVMVRKSH